MGSSRFWLKDADEESKSISHELPRSHWLKATGQCVIERYLSATMPWILEANFSLLPQDVNEPAYKRLVRPILEYGSLVWDPYTKELQDESE